MALNSSNLFLSISGSGNITESFVEDSFSLDSGLLHEILKTFEAGKVVSQIPLKTRLLTISIENQEKVNVYLGETTKKTELKNNETFTTEFYLFLIQTEQNLFVLTISDFNICDHVNQEPFLLQDALMDYHDGLKKCIGLKYGKAYFGSTTEEMNETERKNTGIVAVIETKFKQFQHENQSYILFTL